MKNLKHNIFGIVWLSLGGIVGGASPAHATTRVNTAGAACGFASMPGQVWSAAPSYAQPWVIKRYSNGGVSNPDTNEHDITCPVIRVPSAGSNANFYVDGNNQYGGSTTCTLFLYDFQGNYVQSTNVGFPTAASQYDLPLGLTFHSAFDYMVLRCTLPPSDHGWLRGITAAE
jgi:hypothetical protein